MKTKGKAMPPKAMPGLAAEVMREMMTPPGQEDYDAAFKRAISKRVSNRERMGRLFAAKDAEIQRLRAAMVHAMDDAQGALDDTRRDRGGMEFVLRNVVKSLKTALEKK